MQPRPSLPVLTTLRFFAAAEVVIYHAPNHAELPTDFIRGVFSAGYEAVTFFFILSGFVLTYVYTGSSERDYLNASARTFWRARFARIAPAYYLALILALPAFLYGAAVARIIPVHLLVLGLVLVPLFMQAWWPPAAFLWNGPAWSLSVEFFFYAIFPVLARLTNRLPRDSLLVFAFALVVVMALGRAAMPSPQAFGTNADAWRNFQAYFPLFHLPQFILGMALGRRFLFGPAVAPRLHAAMLYAGLAALVALFGFRSILPPWAAWLRTDVGLAVLFGLIIYGGAGVGSRGAILASPALVLLGEASYAMYILHSPILFWWTWLTSKVMGVKFPFVVDLGLSLALVLGASLLTYLYVETPLRRWLRGMSREAPGWGTRIRT